MEQPHLPMYMFHRKMELRHLRYFIAVAESGSFRVAAERIHVTQPAITRQIHDLEAQVEATLFRRTTTGADLTPAGEAFLRKVRVAMSMLDTAVRSARGVASGAEGSLRIGFVENTSWDGPVPDALARYQAEVPGVHLELLPLNTPEQIELLVADQIDGAFIYTFDELPAGLTALPVANRGVILAVPRQWGWPEGQAVHARRLNDKPTIFFPRQTYPAYYDHVLDACHQAGITLDIVQEVSTEAAILSLVSANIGMAIVNAGNRSRRPERVQFLDLADLSLSIPLVFAYRSRNANPALARFTSMIEEST